MSIQIKLKNSVVQDSTPSASDLPEVGELAVNGNINSIGGFMRASDNSIVKIFGPGSVTTPTATTTVSGIAELATSSETTTGTATNRVVTPAGLNAVTVAERTTSNTNYVAKAGSTLTGVLTMPNGSNSAPAINFGDSDSGIFGGTNTVSLAAGGTTGLTLNSSGFVNVPTRLGVGVASPDVSFEVSGGADAIGRITGTTTAARLDLKTNSHHRFIQVLESDGGLRFYNQTFATEMLRIDSLGRLLVGNSSSLNVGSGTGGLIQLSRTSGDVHQSLNLFKADNAGSILAFGKSRSATIGSYTVVQDDDELGVIRFAGADGTDLQSQAASISAFVDGTPGANDMPGRLTFSTTADNASSPTERMVIKSDGKIGIGITSPDELLHIKATAVNSRLLIENTNNTVAGIILKNSVQQYAIQSNVNDIIIRDITDSATRVHLDTSGNISIGGTSPSTQSAKFQTRGTSQNATRINMHHEGNSSASISANGGLVFGSDTANGTTERMRLDTSGRLGIGTSSPGNKLQVVDAAGSGGFVTALYNTIGSGDVGGHVLFLDANRSDTTNTKLIDSRDNKFTVFSNGAANFSSNVVVDGGTVRCNSGFSSDTDLILNADANNNASNSIIFKESGTETARFKGDGDLLLTRATAGGGNETLLITGNYGAGSDQALQASRSLRFYSGGSNERLRILNTGEVGIGTSSPDMVLHVEGGGTDLLKIECTSAGNLGAHMQLNHNSSSPADDDVVGAIEFAGKDSSGNGTIYSRIRGVATDVTDGTEDGALVFGTRVNASFAERMRINGANVGIGTATPGTLLHLSGGGNTALSINTGNNSGDNSTINFGDSADGNVGFINYDHGTNVMQFSVGGERMVINSAGNIGIGGSAPNYQLHVVSNMAVGGHGFAQQLTFSSTAIQSLLLGTGYRNMSLNALGGSVGIGTTTPESNLEVKGTSTTLGGVGNSTTVCGGKITVSDPDGRKAAFFAPRTSDAGIGTITNHVMTFLVSNTEKARMMSTNQSDPAFLIGTSTNSLGTSSFGTAIFYEGSLVVSRNVTGSNAVVYFGGTQGNANVQGDGDLINTNNSYGQISDETLKQDIVDAGSQWDDIKALRVRKFRFKSNPTGVLQIGVVAQEVETVSAGLVSESNTDIKSGAGEKVKSVKYSVLYMKAVKCLQEAMAKIEVLETKVAALEAA